MKAEIRLPTDTYAYINFEVEGTIEEILEMEREIKAHRVAGEGLTSKELDLIVENMCLAKTTVDGVNLWAKATDSQKVEINRLKRILKRLAVRQNHEVVEEIMREDIGAK